MVDLVLNNDDGAWKVADAKAQARPIYDKVNKKPLVVRDDKLASVIDEQHNATRTFVGKLIGKSPDNMYSYLALLQSDPTVQIVNNAQTDYTRRFIQGDPDLADLPVLSAAAPFKVGGRKKCPGGFRRGGKRGYDVPQRGGSLSLPEYAGGGESDRCGSDRMAGVLRQDVQSD